MENDIKKHYKNNVFVKKADIIILAYGKVNGLDLKIVLFYYREYLKKKNREMLKIPKYFRVHLFYKCYFFNILKEKQIEIIELFYQ